MRKNFSENFPQFGHSSSENLDSPVLGRKNLKNTGFSGPQIITCPGRLLFSGQPCLLSAGKWWKHWRIMFQSATYYWLWSAQVN